jgi:mRNA interferase MazF
VKRGDIIIVAPPSPFNKPRPALIVQQYLSEEDELLTVAFISSDLTRVRAFRIPIMPTAGNGLTKPSEIQIDHIQIVEVKRIGSLAGEADAQTMRQVDVAMRVFFGL